MKKLSLLFAFSALLVLLSTSFLEALPGQQMCRLRVTLAPESTVASAQIFVNGQAKGTVYRGRASEFILPFTRQATVRLVHGATVVDRQLTLIPGRWVDVSIPLVTATKGSIRVHLDGGPATAQVYVDNAYKGTVSRGRFVDIPNVDAGNHQVRVQNGSAQQQTTASVVAGQTATVRMTLQVQPVQGQVRITLDASSETATAAITVDGAARGTIFRGRTLALTLPTGARTIRLSHSDLSQEQTVNVPAGGTVNANFVLQKPKGMLRFTLERASRVRMAQVEIDGASRGTVVPGRNYTWELPAGQHTVRVHQGSMQETATVTITSGQTTPLSLTLRQPKGRLSVTHAGDSAVLTATLYLNGASNTALTRGTTITLDLDAGNYTLQLKNGNFESDAVPVSLGADQTLPVTLTIVQPKGVVNLTYSGESAHAWATVYIDGQQSDRIRRGQTKRYEVESGFRTFEVRAQNETAQQRIMVSRNRERSLTLKLESSTGRLAVTLEAGSSAPSAQLTVNGQNRGTINRGQTLNFDDLAPGTATVVMTANGMTEQGQAQISRGQTASITLSFRQQTGTLVVSLLPESRAAFARVMINGVYRFTVNRGQTRNLDLPAGVYTVILEGGRAPQTIRQVVESGKMSRIVMNLQ